MLVFAFQGLIKDKAILSAEVLHEYDTKVWIRHIDLKKLDLTAAYRISLLLTQFVNPRLHGIKKDVGTMTNEAEMVDSWRGFRYRE